MKQNRFGRIAALLLTLAITLGCAGAALAVTEIQTEAAYVVAEIVTGAYDKVYDRMAPETKWDITEQQIVEAWAKMQDQLGKFESVQNLVETRQDPYDIVQAYLQHEYGVMEMIIVFNEQDELHALNMIPYVAYSQSAELSLPEGAVEESISLRPGAEDDTEALLSLPAGEGPFPAVVLLHDIDPSDRDGRVLGIKPFRDLAVGLAESGVATLRYDKYTYAHADLLGEDALTVEQEYAKDLRDAVAALQTDARIGEIYIAGLGEGGTLTPRLLSEMDGALAGGILLASSPRPLWSVQQTQNKDYIATLPLDKGMEALAVVGEEMAKLERIDEMDDAEKQTETIFGLPIAYHLDVITPDPLETAASLGLPLLILQGENDFDISAKEDYAVWQEGLEDVPGVTMKLYPGLSHLFTAVINSQRNYQDYAEGGNVSKEISRDIAAWIAEQAE